MKSLYTLIRPLLFKLDPELTHDITLQVMAKLQRTFLRKCWEQPRVNDPATIAGLDFPNRLGLAAGLDKNARCVDALCALGFGFIEVGTITPLSQQGNPKPRMFRLPEADAIINRLGFNNEGLEAFVDNIEEAIFREPSFTKQQKPTILGVNIGKNANTEIEDAAEDYLLGLEGVYAYADYITINISSPNTANLRSLQSDQALDDLLGVLNERRNDLTEMFNRRVPLFLKIAPDLTEEQIEVISIALKQHQMDGVIATNTTIDRTAVKDLPHSEEAGGLSGRVLLTPSNQIIQQLRAHLGSSFPIIGVGGVFSGNDAVSKIKAGANLVQIYTGLVYQGPALVHESAYALKKAFHQMKLKKLEKRRSSSKI